MMETKHAKLQASIDEQDGWSYIFELYIDDQLKDTTSLDENNPELATELFLGEFGHKVAPHQTAYVLLDNVTFKGKTLGFKDANCIKVGCNYYKEGECHDLVDNQEVADELVEGRAEPVVIMNIDYCGLWDEDRLKLECDMKIK